jgi:hypothetical protein
MVSPARTVSTPAFVNDLKNLTILEPNCFLCLWSSEGGSGSSCWTAALTSDWVALNGRSEAFGLRFSWGGWRSALGGGGRGALFASPMRKRVSESCAFVGMPFRIVLLVR